MFKNKKNKGFTLIELLVVIAIIGILASIVLVSLNSARAKARDVRRVGDLRQVALALELYYDDVSSAYPVDATPGAGCNAWTTMGAALRTNGFMSSVPVDPQNTGGQIYKYEGSASTYILAVTLESPTHSALSSDYDTDWGGCSCDAAGEYCIKP